MRILNPSMSRATFKWETFLKKRNFKILLFCFSLFLANSVNAQTISLKGTITNQNGEPLAGATIQVKGSSIATTTQTDGSFQLEVPQNSTLSISYIGYINKDLKIGSSGYSNLNVQLIADKNELEHVVVVGYGTRKKSDVTGAIVSISEQAIKDIPAANLAQALQGQGAGIDIQKSGGNSKPGATPSILIRGSRSVLAGNNPLIVIDGIPFNGNINDLNQDDVASVEILKDASSTAIYGSRGANGVILITTKRGKTGKPVFSYNGYAGNVRTLGEYPVMNGEEFALFKKWAFVNGIYSGSVPKYTGIDDPRLQVDGLSAEEQEGIRKGRNTNWQKLIYKPGFITNHQLSISGGSEITQFSISGGYFKETGIYPGQDFERFSIKASLDQQLGKIFKVGLNSLNTFTTTKGESANPMAQALRSSPLVSPYDSLGNLVNEYVPGSASQVWNVLGNFLPGASVEKRKRFGTFTTLYVDVNILKGLKYKFNAGAEIRSDVYGNFYAAKTSNNQGSQSTSQNRSNFRTNYTLENIITYDNTFFKKHKLNFTGVYSFQEQKTQSNQFGNTNIAADYLQYYNPTFGANLVGEGSFEQWDLLSYMARVNYSFDDRYLLTLAVRSDGSSRLAPGNKYHTYPSAAVAWNIHKENFFNASGISNLKLRVSYGSVGNANIDPYQTLGLLSPIVYNFGSTTTTGVFPTNAPNSSLAWEYTSTINVGLDFGILHNRISGSLEVYKQFTNSLLLRQNLPQSSGTPNPILKNVGKTENKGIELQLSTVNIAGRSRNNFSWTTDLNIFLNRGKITKLANGVTKDVANNWFVGSPIGVYYDYKRVGIWQNTNKDSALAKSLGLTVTGAGSVIGQIRVDDLNGDSKIDATNDRMIIGSSQPDWEGGMTNRFGFKGFDLTIVAFARVGGTLKSTLQGGGFVNTFQGTYNNLKAHYWTPTNGENYYPKPNANYTNTPMGSLLGYFEGTYVKIRALSLGYNLPKNVADKIGARSVRIYSTAEDPIILFSAYRKKFGGLDPENAGNSSSPSVTQLNVDTPSNWSLIFGVNISF
jgi:TonB-linked SusC/RagA family outer membrane protein